MGAFCRKYDILCRCRATLQSCRLHTRLWAIQAKLLATLAVSVPEAPNTLYLQPTHQVTVVPAAPTVKEKITCLPVLRSPLQEYDYQVSRGVLRDDPNQRKTITALSELHKSLALYRPPSTAPDHLQRGSLGWFGSVRHSWAKVLSQFPSIKESRAEINGIYLYGDVGCGKTMLMDLFYGTIPLNLSKRRIHFHQFMQRIHKRSHQIKAESKLRDLDPIPMIAAEIAHQSTVLCFDEFQVTDVADAMLLRRLLMILMSPEYGVVLFATSNRAPDDLYLNGIQRALFVPCIRLIKGKCRIIYLNSPVDYRKIPKPLSSVYFHPKPGVRYTSKTAVTARKVHVDQWFSFFSKDCDTVTTGQVVTDFSLNVWGRKLAVPKCVPQHVAQFSFAELCGGNKLAGDFLALANLFESFIITDIPYLSIEDRDLVRRFITFLDAVYDAHGRIATTATALFKDIFVEPEDLQRGNYLLYRKQQEKGQEDTFEDDELVTKHGFDKSVAKKAAMFANDEEKFAFARALSRLQQMSTTEWIEALRRPRD